MRRFLRSSKILKGPRKKRFDGEDDSVLQCCIAYNKLGGYCIPLSSSHRPAAQKVLSGRIWESGTIDYIIDHHKGGDIIHAGTYFGDFIPALSRACGASSTLWAFEPNPENYRCAFITIQINGLSNVVITNAGLGNDAGLHPFEVRDASGQSRGGSSKFVLDEVAQDGRTVSIRTVRIDDHIPVDREVSILQLDVEGFEKEALAGGLNTIRRCRPLIILENVPDRAWMEENILSMGYRETGRVHANTIFEP